MDLLVPVEQTLNSDPRVFRARGIDGLPAIGIQVRSQFSPWEAIELIWIFLEIVQSWIQNTSLFTTWPKTGHVVSKCIKFETIFLILRARLSYNQHLQFQRGVQIAVPYRLYLPRRFYSQFSILASVKPIDRTGGYLFAIINAYDTVVDVGVLLEPSGNFFLHICPFLFLKVLDWCVMFVQEKVIRISPLYTLIRESILHPKSSLRSSFLILCNNGHNLQSKWEKPILKDNWIRNYSITSK